MKVFYRTLPSSADDGNEKRDGHTSGSESLRKDNLMVEEVRLSPRLEAALWEMITQSTNILPAGPGGVGGARRFGEWDVGLLAVFTADDVI